MYCQPERALAAVAVETNTLTVFIVVSMLQQREYHQSGFDTFLAYLSVATHPPSFKSTWPSVTMIHSMRQSLSDNGFEEKDRRKDMEKGNGLLSKH